MACPAERGRRVSDLGTGYTLATGPAFERRAAQRRRPQAGQGRQDYRTAVSASRLLAVPPASRNGERNASRGARGAERHGRLLS
jgi:hypothetical protein